MNNDAQISKECHVSSGSGEETVLVTSTVRWQGSVDHNGAVFSREIAKLTEIWLSRIADVSGTNAIRVEMLASGIAVAIFWYWFLVNVIR